MKVDYVFAQTGPESDTLRRFYPLCSVPPLDEGHHTANRGSAQKQPRNHCAVCHEKRCESPDDQQPEHGRAQNHAQFSICDFGGQHLLVHGDIMGQIAFSHGQKAFCRARKNVVIVLQVPRVWHGPRELFANSDFRYPTRHIRQVALGNLAFKFLFDGIFDTNNRCGLAFV